MVAKLGNKKVKRLFCKEVKPQAIGGRNGWLLTGNAEDEEIVLSHYERVWLQSNIYKVAFIDKNK